MTNKWEIPEYTAQIFAPKKNRYALVIPVINEGSRIQKQLQALSQAAYNIDIIIADGGSTDESLSEDELRAAGVRALLIKNDTGKLSAQLRMGYGWSLLENYDGILTMDGNGKDGIEAIPTFIQKLDEGYGYIQGSRYTKGGQAINTPLEREIGNRFIHSPMLSLAGGQWLTDTTNGFRAYSADFLRDEAVRPFRAVFQNYELLFYLTARAGQLGYKVCEVPVLRRYPDHGKVPTKIAGWRGKVAILIQTFYAAAGRYAP